MKARLVSHVFFICSIVGSLGNPGINGTGIPLSVAPALGGVAAAPLVPGLGQISGPGALPTGVAVISQTSAVIIPTECLLLINMFDPTVEVSKSAIMVYFFHSSFSLF